MRNWLGDLAGMPTEESRQKFGDALKAIEALFAATEFGKAGSAASFADYKANVAKAGEGDHDVFMRVMQAVYIKQNLYCGGAKNFSGETGATSSDKNPGARVVVEGGKTYLEFTADKEFLAAAKRASLVSTQDLGTTRISAARFDDRNGDDIIFDKDFLGAPRAAANNFAGPFAQLKEGANKILVWQK